MLDTGFKPQVLSISQPNLSFSFFIAATHYLSPGLLSSFLNYFSAHNIYPSTYYSFFFFVGEGLEFKNLLCRSFV